MGTDNTLYSAIAAVCVAVITSGFSFIGYQRNKRNDVPLGELANIVRNTKTPVQDLLTLIESLQFELKTSNTRHTTEIKYFQKQLDTERSENIKLREELEQIRNKVDQHARLLKEEIKE